MPTRERALHVPEQKHEYPVLKLFRGLNTQAEREALDPKDFSWIENAIPIGNANIRTVPQVDTATATVTSAIAQMHFATVGTTNYQIAFCTDGSGQAVNLSNGSVATIFSAGSFTSPTTLGMDQWKNERILVADNSGYYSWDGIPYGPGGIATISVVAAGSGFTSTPVVTFTGGGGSGATAVATLSGGGVSSVTITASGSGFTAVPAIGFTGGGGTSATATAFTMPTLPGNAVSVYSGRAWIFNGRLLNYTAPDTWYDTNEAAAAGSATIYEANLRQRVFGSKALDNFLYVFGDGSVIIIGDVKVSGSSTTYSQTFLSSTTGTTLQNTITSMERAILFVNKQGVYALYGASVQKISDALDGIFPDIDFSEPVTAGLVQIYNHLCYAFNCSWFDEDLNTTRRIQLVYFNKRWFVTSQGALTIVSPSSINGLLSLYGTTGQDVAKLYSNTTQTIATTIQTSLMDFGNEIFDKQIIRAGIEYRSPANASVTLTVDTGAQGQVQTFTGSNQLLWYNTAGALITWQNTAAQTITWLTTGMLSPSALFDVTGKYLGFTATSNSPQLVVTSFRAEYEVRAPWGP